jgi:hypothetical protein
VNSDNDKSLLDMGHFAFEEEAPKIAELMLVLPG